MKYLQNEWGETVPLNQIRMFKTGCNCVHARMISGDEISLLSFLTLGRDDHLPKWVMPALIKKIEDAPDGKIIEVSADILLAEA